MSSESTCSSEVFFLGLSVLGVDEQRMGDMQIFLLLQLPFRMALLALKTLALVWFGEGKTSHFCFSLSCP